MLVALGTWQLQRLAWKAELIRRAEAQLAEAAMPVPSGPLDGLDFRRLSARGTYLHEAAFAFGLSAFDGQPGARLVTPLRLDDGRVILVDRGWLPQSLLPPNTPPDLQPGGSVTVEGIGRWRGDIVPGWMAPADSPAQRRWFTWDIPSIEQALGLELAPLELVLERSEGPAALPKASTGRDRFPQQSSGLCADVVWARRGAPGHLHPVQLHQAGCSSSVTSIRRIAAGTAVLIYALIVLGALVRTTNSGLSCPDWPTCYGHWVPLPSDLAAIPNLGYSYGQVMLEWVHRLIAGVFWSARSSCCWPS